MKKLALHILSLALIGCIPEPDFSEDYTIKEESGFGSFEFSTIGKVSLDFLFLDPKGQPFVGIPIDLKHPETGKTLHKGFTDKTGKYSQAINLPTYLKEVILETGYVGLPNRLIIPVKNKRVTLTYRGEVNPNEVIQYDIDPRWNGTNNLNSRVLAPNFALEYAAPYDKDGVPSNILPGLDYISAQVLAYINESLPEGRPVPSYHPTYLADGRKTTLDVLEEADVWLTFVHEGAGWRNTIGFYTYPTNQPPNSLEEIKKITILFPNLSKTGSGGNLKSGQKVKIGKFLPGTTVGLVLLANGWDGAKVSGWKHVVFADKKLNPEPNSLLKQHNVLLWDEENKHFLLGFEDVRRDNIPINCDQDFNDAILFVSSNPIRAISTIDVSPIDKPNTLDQDGDGINDNFDEYPNDPSKAYDAYYPSSTTYGSFAFEDSWPEMGDYDFNDLVVDYQFQHTFNGANNVTQIKAKFKFRAAGAGFRNGFGFQMEINPNLISSLSGNQLGPTLITTNPNGTEANQSKATIIVSDNIHQLFGITRFINTDGSTVDLTPKELVLTISLTSPVPLSQLGSAPYNPFLIISQDRGREVHLPGYNPTSLAQTSLFGTADDNSIQAGYYKSKTSLPWAIHLPETFAYPKEKADIRKAHLHFKTWANSSGYSYMDWYRDLSGYRDYDKIY